jgi:hypothetical protein
MLKEEWRTFMHLRSLIVAVMAALTLAAGGAVGLAASAGAAEAATTAASAARLADPPCQLASSPVYGNNALDLFANYNYSGDEWVCGCDPGTTYRLSQQVESFESNCASKAWLQYQGGSPAPYCISELQWKSYVGPEYMYPVSVLIGKETGEC